MNGARSWPSRSRRAHFPQPLWTGAQDISGKTVFTYVEQGLGDTIQFYRFVATLLARGARVILSGVQDALLPLLADGRWPVTLISNRMVPQDFDLSHSAGQPAAGGWDADGYHTCGHALSEGQPQRVAQWRMRIGDRASRSALPGRARRRCPWPRHAAAHFAGLAKLPGVRLISLQKGSGSRTARRPAPVESLGEDSMPAPAPSWTPPR